MAGKERGNGAVLDDVSKAIIEQLQEDGRRAYATIGKAVGRVDVGAADEVAQRAGLIGLIGHGCSSVRAAGTTASVTVQAPVSTVRRTSDDRFSKMRAC